jgi:glycosyltransferase involved in cell wall biosynthesis
VPNGFDPGPSLWVAAAVALALCGFFIKSRWNYLAIPRITASEAEGKPPDCMVVIPARNEEASIARAVESFPADTVIVVDDHSEDGTADAARQAGAGVLPAPELARGAIGKANACCAGARILTSRWVLFTDADAWFEPGFLEALVARAETFEFAFLSVHLQQEWETWAERMVGPVAEALYFCGAGARAGPAVFFNGQCMLVLREAYEFVGGHSAVLASLIEDAGLAVLAQRHRLKIGMVRAPRLGHVRMGGIRQRVRRNAIRFTMVRPLIGISILLAALSMAVWLPVLVWLLLDGQWLAALIFASLPPVLLGSWYRSPLKALFAPFAMFVLPPVVFDGFIAAVTTRRVEWKGRTI